MGDDSVIECLADGGNVTAFHSWNAGWNAEQPTYANTRAEVVNI